MKQLIVAGALSCALALAQRSGPPDPAQFTEMRVNRLAETLSLTADQKTKATAIFTEAATASQELRESTRSTRESLNNAIEQNNAVAIDQFSADLGRISGQMTAIESKAEAAFYALLTAEQRGKYQVGRMGGGPGGPGMGRFGPPPDGDAGARRQRR